MPADALQALACRCARIAWALCLVPLLSAIVCLPAAAQQSPGEPLGSRAGSGPHTTLIVSVRYGAGREPGQAGGGSRSYHTAQRSKIQQLTMLEGSTAYLTHSSVQPYPTIALLPVVGAEYGVVGGLDEQELRTGFTVTPLVQGNEVILDIAVQADRRSQDKGGAIDSTQLQTRVRGALGSWISLSGEGLPAAKAAGVKTYSTAPKSDARDEQIWVRVDRQD